MKKGLILKNPVPGVWGGSGVRGRIVLNRKFIDLK
jgi:hypothetical protein